MRRQSSPEQESIARVVRWAIMIFFAYILFTGGYHTPTNNHPKSDQPPPTASGGKAETAAAQAPEEKNCVTQDSFNTFGSVAMALMPSMVPVIHTDTVKEGEGQAATCGQHAEVHYELKTESGSLVFSNYNDAPTRITIGDGGILRGMEMGLQGLKVGGERRVAFPYVLGLGRVNDLRTVRNLDKFALKPSDLKDVILVGRESLVSLSPALPKSDEPVHVIERKFNSGNHVYCGDTVSVRLTIWRLDGTKLYSTDDNSKVLIFTVGASEVPYGIEEAMMGMGEDGERTAIIPAAYMQPVIKDINWPEQPTLLSYNWPKETVIAQIYLSHIGNAPASTTSIPLPDVPAVPTTKPSSSPASKPAAHAVKGTADSDKDDGDDDDNSPKH